MAVNFKKAHVTYKIYTQNYSSWTTKDKENFITNGTEAFHILAIPSNIRFMKLCQ